MMQNGDQNHKSTISLAEIAHQAMLERGFNPDIPPAVEEAADAIKGPAVPVPSPNLKDMRNILWVSIDNDDTKDIDQLTYAETTPEGNDRIFIAVADVDALVEHKSSIDRFAAYNTTSVYTPTVVFPMLPLRLSTDLTSLIENGDRGAIIVEMEIAKNGAFDLVDIYPGWVNNRAKLTYNGVAPFLEHKAPLLHPSKDLPAIEEQLRLQDRIAHRIKDFRYQQGALSFASTVVDPIIDKGFPVGLRKSGHNRANMLIENFMIAANTGVTHYLAKYNMPTLRRVVRVPKRWDRIVALAKKYNFVLPDEPDSKALRDFLVKQRNEDPLNYPDLSLAIIKLIGRGEYVVGLPGKTAPGHFDLALQEYAHTTAPNRRYPDLVMQRQLKNHFYGGKKEYSNDELFEVAKHCTQKEDDATKVERRVRKSAAAMVVEQQVGREFSAMITGCSPKGTFVRLLALPIEGKLMKTRSHCDVGDFLTVKLQSVDVLKGFIDFVEAD